jgi:D-alanyl-D-alanine carboxypeptidase
MNPKMTLRRLTTTAVAIAAAAVLVPATSGTADATASDPAGSRSELRQTLQRDADALLPQGFPGILAAGQTSRGPIAVRAGVGNTDTGRPVPWNAKFRIGSLTKTFVATTVLQLVGDGRLSLDDTVDHWLPGLVSGNGNDGSKVTVRQLLQHTSGLPEYLPELDYLFSKDGFEKHRYDTVTARQAVRLAMKHQPDFAPGTSWHYSNTNYVLAGMIIEKATGHSWQSEVRRRIVKPLGLHDTTLPGTRSGIPRPHATGYERFAVDPTAEEPTYGPRIDATRQNPSWGGAAGEIISTTADTNRFLRAVARGSLLKPAQEREMKRTVPVNAGFEQAWPGVRYGLGIMRVPSPCGAYWAHGGDIMGFMTRDGVTADGRRSIVVSANTDSPIPDEGVQRPDHDMTTPLIEHALCG